MRATQSLSALTDGELLARLPEVRRAERRAIAELIATLGEVDRRRLYLEEACSSLFAYCTERLGYSENEAQTRIAVARACLRFPQAMTELELGAIHLTGLALLAPRLSAENASTLLGEGRGKSRREIEALLARWFPKPDVLPSITPLESCTLLEQGDAARGTPRATGGAVGGTGTTGASPREPERRARVEPLSATSFRVEFTASAELREKIERARDLLSHSIPSGDVAALIERAMDQLIATETKRRAGAGKPRKRRESKAGSRHVPVAIECAVRERDGDQCTFTNGEGRRCSAKRFLTVEHIDPFAKGGPTTVDNCTLLCSAHNAHRARQGFGAERIREKIAAARARRELDCYGAVLSGLANLGFARSDARRAVEAVRQRGVELRREPVLRAALSVLSHVPP